MRPWIPDTGRYRPWLVPERDRWVIMDWAFTDFCALPDETGALRPLTWGSRAGAEGWLHRCYQTWSKWEAEDKVNVPARWRPALPPDRGPNPFDDPDWRGRRWREACRDDALHPLD
jgi:hypothetical protein